METLIIDKKSNIATVTLNRPNQKNAVNLQMSRELNMAFEQLNNDDDIRAIVLTGAGNVFSAGIDLTAIKEGQRKDIYAIEGGFTGFIKREFSKPVVAAVNGHAFAAGFEIVLACDLIVTTNRAKFGLPEVKRGLVAGAGGLIRLPKIVPTVIASELALTGEPITAERAFELGVVNIVAPHEEVYTQAIKLSQKIINNPENSVNNALQLVRASSSLPEAEVWELNEKISDEVYNHKNAKEGINSFLDQREPNWE